MHLDPSPRDTPGTAATEVSLHVAQFPFHNWTRDLFGHHESCYDRHRQRYRWSVETSTESRYRHHRTLIDELDSGQAISRQQYTRKAPRHRRHVCHFTSINVHRVIVRTLNEFLLTRFNPLTFSKLLFLHRADSTARPSCQRSHHWAL